MLLEQGPGTAMYQGHSLQQLASIDASPQASFSQQAWTCLAVCSQHAGACSCVQQPLSNHGQQLGSHTSSAELTGLRLA